MEGLEVGIIGGGLGGLAAAIALRQAGHRATVFEQTAKLRPVGAGISLWPNGAKVLSALGLGGQLADGAALMDRMRYEDMSGASLCDFSLAPLYETVGQRAWPLPRAHLQEMLIEALGSEHYRLGARCVSVHSSVDSATVTFAEGGHFEGDVLIGADGTHSAVRTWVVGREVPRRYVGYVNFNGLAPFDETISPPGTWVTWVGEGRRASVMPAGRGLVYAFFDVPMPQEEASSQHQPEVADELREAFGGWAGPVRLLIDKMAAGPINRIAIHDLPVVEQWYRGRVVLLGDAVHAMAPDLGQGGCQALEDALVLSRSLSGTDVSIPDAFARYQEERLPRTAEIVRRARKRAAITHGGDPVVTAEWYRELARETGESVIAGLVESVVTGPCR